jgi:hypothetical protein
LNSDHLLCAINGTLRISASGRVSYSSNMPFNKEYYLLSTKPVDNFVDDSGNKRPNMANNKDFRYFACFLMIDNIIYIQ